MPHPGHPIIAHAIFLSILYVLIKSIEITELEVMTEIINRISQIDAEVLIKEHRAGHSKRKFVNSLLKRQHNQQDYKLDLYLSSLLKYLSLRVKDLS
jgi:hypothetical protein